MSGDAQKDALLSHVVSQIETNVQFLISQNYISQAEASTFLNKLSTVSANGSAASMPTPAPFGRRAMPSAVPPAPASAPPATSSLPTCKALWAYNEHGTDADDLSFSAGDIIEIVDETNGDWWMGRVHGKQALFPSSYAEKIQAPAPVAPARAVPPAAAKPYRPFGAAHASANQPPPATVPATNSVGLQQDPGQEQKKSKFGKYGNTMAHSAAGGVGFGAGSAIGGGLVRAIF